MAPLVVNQEVTLTRLAAMIDHSILHPTMTDAQMMSELETAKLADVCAVCVKPYFVSKARDIMATSKIKVCAVIAFPHGNSTTDIKVLEARQAVEDGATEIDMVVNVGKVLSKEYEYVENEIRAINEAVVSKGAILKVIFENDFLMTEHIAKLSQICSDVGVAFIKTSTGYGYVKQPDGTFRTFGATLEQLRLMREVAAPKVQIKAAGGVRTLDDLLRVRALGVTRIGATATTAILEQAKKRGIGNKPIDVTVELPDGIIPLELKGVDYMTG
jgi:deoxyribose-phosphate aldolase